MITLSFGGRHTEKEASSDWPPWMMDASSRVYGGSLPRCASVYTKVRSALRHLQVFVLGPVINFIIRVKALKLQVLSFPHHAAPKSSLETNPVRDSRNALTENRVAPPTVRSPPSLVAGSMSAS